MRYDAYSCIAVFHRDGILEKGRATSEPTSYIVEIDEMGNPSIKYADGTPYSVNISDGGGSDAAQDENVDLPETD